MAALAAVSCEPVFHTETRPDVVFNFGSVEVVTTENSARVNAAKPSITIDGVEEQGVAISLEYWTATDESDLVAVEEFEQNGGRIIFSIDNLQPSTEYRARLVVSGEYGDGRSDIFSIITLQHIPVAEYRCECKVDPKGVLANVLLDNVAFTLDGVESPLAKVEFKYVQSMSGGQWTTIELAAEDIERGFKIPAQEGAYLNEQCHYSYVVTLIPEDPAYENFTLNGTFSTVEAVVTSDLSSPQSMLDQDGLHIFAYDIEVYFDGVKLDSYPYLDYGFIYRTSANEEWSDFIKVDYSEQQGMTFTLPFESIKMGGAFEFVTAVRAGIAQQILISDSVVIPLDPFEPEPPTPPVTGDADTSELAGQWHLTQWRGAEPGFDVYLSITEDGVVSLFQRMESRLWQTYYSTVAYEDGIIAGVYTDGVAWGSAYYVTVDQDTMTWTSTEDSGDISVYTRSSLPDMTNPEIRTLSSSDKRFL